MSKFYLAYGSNMNREQMKYRCPTAAVVGVSELKGYRLCFKGRADGNGVATIEPCEDSTVPILIWCISPEDEKELDKFEGFPRLYEKAEFQIELDGIQPFQAMAYIMTPGRDYSIPAKYYYSMIFDAYKDFGFDTDILDEAVRFSVVRGAENGN